VFSDVNCFDGRALRKLFSIMIGGNNACALKRNLNFFDGIKPHNMLTSSRLTSLK
jgi:hypothetical protein